MKGFCVFFFFFSELAHMPYFNLKIAYFMDYLPSWYGFPWSW